jgi:hypothetical protein
MKTATNGAFVKTLCLVLLVWALSSRPTFSEQDILDIVVLAVAQNPEPGDAAGLGFSPCRAF